MHPSLAAKLIHPLPPQAALDDSPVLDRDSPGGSAGNVAAVADSWIQSLNRDRPPTPPRGRLGANRGAHLSEF